MKDRPLQHLKSIDFSRIKDGLSPNLPIKNAIWLLLFLPSLRSASLFIYPNKMDLEFFEAYSESYRGKSKVQQVFATFSFAYNEGFADQGNWLEEEKNLAVKRFLETTKDLVQASLYIHTAYASTVPARFQGPVAFSCLEGLESSYSTLRHLEVESFSGSLGNWLLSKLEKLERLAIDGVGLTKVQQNLVEMAGMDMNSPSIEIQLPSDLKELRLLYSHQVRNNSTVETMLATLGSLPRFFPKGFKKIIVVEVPMLNDGSPARFTRNEMEVWKQEFKGLEKQCGRDGIELEILNLRDAGE